MKKRVIFYLISIVVHIAAQAYNDSAFNGQIELHQVEICNDAIRKLIVDSIIPDSKKWDRSANENDFYIRIHHPHSDDDTYSLRISLSLENTKHQPLYLNESYRYAIVDGYILFLDQEFSELYTCLKQETQVFSFDGTNNREEPDKVCFWIFDMIGDIYNPCFYNDTRMRYYDSPEYRHVKFLKFLQDEYPNVKLD